MPDPPSPAPGRSRREGRAQQRQGPGAAVEVLAPPVLHHREEPQPHRQWPHQLTVAPTRQHRSHQPLQQRQLGGVEHQSGARHCADHQAFAGQQAAAPLPVAHRGIQRFTAAGALAQRQGVAAQGQQLHGAMHGGGQGLGMGLALAHLLLQPAQLQQQAPQQPRGRRLAGGQLQGQLQQQLGGGQALQPLAQLAVVAQHLQLAHPLQAAVAPTHLQAEMGEGHRRRQAAPGPARAGCGQACEPLGLAEQGEQSVAFSQRLAAQHQPLEGALRHGCAGPPSGPRRGWCPAGWLPLPPG
jgi:hypothetical protein